jgi:hypothetical protein
MILVVAAILALTVMLWITHNGPGVSADSTVYIQTAASVLAGHGFYANGGPLTHYPPIYPILLALVSFLQPDILQTARVLGSILFSLNTTLFGFAVFLATRQSWPATTYAVLFFSSSAAMLNLHTWAWSEPLFLSLSLAGFIFICLYIERSRVAYVAAASVLFSLALATRYIGISLLPPMLFGLLFFSGEPIRSRLYHALVASLLTCAPLSIWLLHNIMAGSATNRSFAVHILTTSDLRDSLHSTADVFLPLNVGGWPKAVLIGLLFAGLAAGLVRVYGQKIRAKCDRSPATVFPVLVILYTATYFLVLALSKSLFDANTPMDSRIMSLGVLFLVPAGISLSKVLSEDLRRPWVWRATVLFILCCTVANLSRAIPWAVRVHYDGQGYNTRQWRASETIAFVRRVPDGTRIYSNGADVIEFLTARRATWLPAKMNLYTLIANGNYINETETMCRDVREGGAFLVFLTDMRGRSKYLPDQAEVESLCKMRVRRSLSDGIILGTGGASLIPAELGDPPGNRHSIRHALGDAGSESRGVAWISPFSRSRSAVWTAPDREAMLPFCWQASRAPASRFAMGFGPGMRLP